MIVTVAEEIKLEDGTIIPKGTSIVAKGVIQIAKGGPLEIINANPYKSGYIIGTDDLTKVKIDIELLTPEEQLEIKNWVEAEKRAAKILHSY